jgi:thiol-disulfide isomerase/thioredoxin
MRWTIAVAGATALALTTLNAPLRWFGGEADAAGDVCDANAKAANLNFTLKDMNNRDVRLADFKGKVILLDFWATWCGPCKVEIPGFVDLQNRYGSAGLQVIGISVDDKLEDLKPYVAAMKMNYPVLQGLDHDDVQDAFGPMFGIPTTVVIARNGNICRKHIGMSSKEAFEKEIRSLL